MMYFDPGWIRTSDDPANPAVLMAGPRFADG
jgi:hypothetical protein